MCVNKFKTITPGGQNRLKCYSNGSFAEKKLPVPTPIPGVYRKIYIFPIEYIDNNDDAPLPLGIFGNVRLDFVFVCTGANVDAAERTFQLLRRRARAVRNSAFRFRRASE